MALLLQQAYNIHFSVLSFSGHLLAAVVNEELQHCLLPICLPPSSSIIVSVKSCNEATVHAFIKANHAHIPEC